MYKDVEPPSYCYGNQLHSIGILKNGKDMRNGGRPWKDYGCTECGMVSRVWDPRDAKAWRKLEEGEWLRRYSS